MADNFSDELDMALGIKPKQKQKSNARPAATISAQRDKQGNIIPRTKTPKPSLADKIVWGIADATEKFFIPFLPANTDNAASYKQKIIGDVQETVRGIGQLPGTLPALAKRAKKEPGALIADLLTPSWVQKNEAGQNTLTRDNPLMSLVDIAGLVSAGGTGLKATGRLSEGAKMGKALETVGNTIQSPVSAAKAAVRTAKKAPVVGKAVAKAEKKLADIPVVGSKARKASKYVNVAEARSRGEAVRTYDAIRKEQSEIFANAGIDAKSVSPKMHRAVQQVMESGDLKLKLNKAEQAQLPKLIDAMKAEAARSEAFIKEKVPGLDAKLEQRKWSPLALQLSGKKKVSDLTEADYNSAQTHWTEQMKGKVDDAADAFYESIRSRVGDAPTYMQHIAKKNINTMMQNIGRAAMPFRKDNVGFLKKYEGRLKNIVRNVDQINEVRARQESWIAQADRFVEEIKRHPGVVEVTADNLEDIAALQEKGYKVVMIDALRNHMKHVLDIDGSAMDAIKRGEDASEVMADGIAKVLKDAAEGGKAIGHAMPPELFQALDRQSKNPWKFLREWGGENIPYAHLVFDAGRLANKAWRAAVLGYSPRWLENNMAGSLIYGALHKDIPFVDQLKYSRKKWRDLVPPEAYGGFAHAELDKAHILQGPFGLLNTEAEQSLRRATYLNEAIPIAKEQLRIAGEAVDAENVMKQLAKGVEDPGMYQQAIDAVNKFHGDYFNMGPVERHGIRAAIPFYGFYRHATKLFFSLPAEHPQRAMLLQSFARMSDDHAKERWIDLLTANTSPDAPAPEVAKLRQQAEADYERMPEYMKDKFPLYLDDDGKLVAVNLGGANPFGPIKMVADAAVGENRQILSSISPFIKVPLEKYASKRDTFTGREFTTPPDEKWKDDRGQWWQMKATGDMAETTEPPVPSFAQLALKQFPPIKQAYDYMAPYGRYDTGELKPAPFNSDNAANNRERVKRAAQNYFGYPAGSYDIQQQVLWNLKNERQAYRQGLRSKARYEAQQSNTAKPQSVDDFSSALEDALR